MTTSREAGLLTLRRELDLLPGRRSSGEFETTPFNPAQAMTGCKKVPIDGRSYVMWVQQSVNRANNQGLPVNGVPDERYRAAVRRFQSSRKLKPTGEVDRATQNGLILSNELSKAYVTWIQQTLNGTGASLSLDGKKGPLTTAAVRAFQQRLSPQLCVDGYVGPKTELRMLDTWCGTPLRPLIGELELELDIGVLESERSKQRVTPQPRLSFFQDATNSSHRNHFECGARRQALLIAALKAPVIGACPRRVGATPYGTGADIVSSIAAARSCSKRSVTEVDVYSHGFSSGIPGNTAGWAGLYVDSFPLVERGAGGRTISDIPRGDLAATVKVVLHGCNIGSGSENFAKSLFEFLAVTLSNPRVFAHHNSGCASRNNSWREYSNAHPNGRKVTSITGLAASCCGR